MRKNYFDTIIVGGGHSGVEAAFALAKLNLSVLLVTMSIPNIAKMSCNPSIGGIAKGHLVREIDALGGIMARAIDNTGIHFRMLNLSKGPAVWAPRAQADKQDYQDFVRNFILNTPNITITEDIVASLSIQNNTIKGIITEKQIAYHSKAVILTTGTFLKGLIHIGDYSKKSGRMGEHSAEYLSNSLINAGFKLGRLKTGTPARIHKDSINYSKVDVQQLEDMPFSFSYSTQKPPKTIIDCYLTYTNKTTHKIISDNINRSPLFQGKIKGIGPRYCPSIEDKVVRFSHKDKHQIFLEPEGLNTDEVYINGLSSSLPKDVQENFIHSIKGLENAFIIRFGYAVEYDFSNPMQLLNTLESKRVKNLYFAGQINGTSGYEEAAAQGLFAGINAGLKIKGLAPFVMDRTESYIAVLVDDLITKGVVEPYRLFTSRAEYRLNLRYDNADERLMHYGHKFSLIDDAVYETFLAKSKRISKGILFIKQKIIGEKEIIKTPFYGENNIRKGAKLDSVLKRSDISIEDIKDLHAEFSTLKADELKQIETQIKYEGYIKKQNDQIAKFKRLENKKIPKDINYKDIKGLLNEAREKLEKVRPVSIGQAMRLEGVNPSDISILMVYIR